jgi:predicted kinase
MSKFYMLIGVPAAGKSTWRVQHAGITVISSDDILDQTAAARGSTYNEVFKENIKFATQLAEERARAAFAAVEDVIWDQTNLTKKSRKSKLALVPENYTKIAVFFPTPEWDEHKQRLDSRPGKSIPWNVLNGMIRSLEEPSYDEGFDEIIEIITA